MLTFLPDGEMLVTEKNGALRLIENGSLREAPIAGTPEVMGRDQGSLLALFWRETSAVAVTPPEKPGFGTKLIDMNITRELKGTIRRDYGAHGLQIMIEIPLPVRTAGEASEKTKGYSGRVPE